MQQATAVTQAPAGKWVVAGTVVLGSFVSVMDFSIVNVAMPQMISTFGVSLDSITWVAVSYSIAEIILVTMAAWLSSLLGRKRFFVWSFVLFTAASLLCGAARSLEVMILARILQGIGGGGLIPLTQAIMLETFPEDERGMAMALYTMGVAVAPAVGPVLGGWLTDEYGWPWIFYILTGAGMSFMFGPMSVAVMRTVPLPLLTAASSLYTLGRRIGGNMGYALVASQIDHRAAFHRARLVEHVTPYDVSTTQALDGLTGRLVAGSGLPPGLAEDSALKLLDGTVNRHATMLAYNDIFWLMGMLFVLGVPFLLLLGGRGRRGAMTPSPTDTGPAGVA